ncbi:TonB-dependent receptor [Sandaracinobacter sp. RS1-74]|uniref:TonB-dependent receptor n=1 Tax=Sandaracinobacteroides sayramensis TaxID=2913411 RepID=UPI001EDB3E77|nr:TonB-dependent receptor [Sandaracinobacteroides sayramensis]MCG2841227.1 TonB-dependent receptor [Sandaracinobacteroides sayramensis]
MAATPNTPFGVMMDFDSHKRSQRSSGLLIAGGVAGLGLLALFLWPSQEISQRPHETKTTKVVLPPPPPPPPPPEPKPVEQPPEPKPMPLEQPQDTPPPPQPSNDPVQGDSALTAREGAGPSNYGLAVGDGGGTKIGGRPGGGDNGFAAYGNVVLNAVRQSAQSDRELSRGRYAVQLALSVDAEGRVTNVRVLNGGDEKRNARIRDVLMGLRLPQRPPAGLSVVRVELNTRAGG